MHVRVCNAHQGNCFVLYRSLRLLCDATDAAAFRYKCLIIFSVTITRYRETKRNRKKKRFSEWPERIRSHEKQLFYFFIFI